MRRAAPGLLQAPRDLERRPRLARAGGHDEERAAAALGHGLDHAVDGGGLVVPDLAAGGVEELLDEGLGIGRKAAPRTIAFPQGPRRGEGVEREALLDDGPVARAVEHREGVSVGAERKGSVEVLRMLLGLLQARSHGVVVVLHLDHREDAALPSRRARSRRRGSCRARRGCRGPPRPRVDGDLLAQVAHHVPARLLNGGRDELRPYVSLGERLLVQHDRRGSHGVTAAGDGGVGGPPPSPRRRSHASPRCTPVPTETRSRFSAGMSVHRGDVRACLRGDVRPPWKRTQASPWGHTCPWRRSQVSRRWTENTRARLATVRLSVES